MADQGPIEQIESRGSAKMDEVRAKASQKVRSAKEAGTGYMHQQQRMAAVEVDGYACALRETARVLHNQSQEGAGYYAERAARAMETLARNLRDKDAGEVADRVRSGIGDFARRQPGLFLGGTIATGFVVGRLLRGTAGELVKERRGESDADVTVSDIAAAPSAYGEKTVAGSAAEGGTSTGPNTAADVEGPVILRPHEPVQHPGGPTP